MPSMGSATEYGFSMKALGETIRTEGTAYHIRKESTEGPGRLNSQLRILKVSRLLHEMRKVSQYFTRMGAKNFFVHFKLRPA